jgi:hypothetical protein
MGVRFSTVLNAIAPEENYHYVELLVQGLVDKRHMPEPSNLEPDKCEGWMMIISFHLNSPGIHNYALKK